MLLSTCITYSLIDNVENIRRGVHLDLLGKFQGTNCPEPASMYE